LIDCAFLTLFVVEIESLLHLSAVSA
jgi:hypothetical protein